MSVPDFTLRVLIAPSTQLAAAASQTAAVDTKGYDYLFVVGSDSEEDKSAASKWTELRLSESDTTPTAFTDGTAIVAFEGGTEVDATHGFEIPTASTTVANGFAFKVDLRGRKRFIVIEQKHPATDHIASYALLMRADRGSEAAVLTTTLARARNVVAG